MRRALLAALVATAIVAAGCETPAPRPAGSPAPASSPPANPPRTTQRPSQPPPPPAEPAKPPVPLKSAAELALDEGVTLYDAGSYNEAIKSLTGAKEIWEGAPDPLKVRAYKYVAFSQCVLGRRTLCRQQFTEALKLDPTFTLEPAERTHPIWGVEYEAAKKALTAPAASRPATTTNPANPRPAANPPAGTTPRPATPKPPGT